MFRKEREIEREREREREKETDFFIQYHDIASQTAIKICC